MMRVDMKAGEWWRWARLSRGIDLSVKGNRQHAIEASGVSMPDAFEPHGLSSATSRLK